MLVLSAALIAPYFIDWTSYRADFEREMSRILGSEVRVEGDASARLLPFPSVTFSDVVVDGTTDTPAMTIGTFSMDAELAPFLRGEVLIFDMRLERPVLHVEMDGEGAIDWAERAALPYFDARHIRLERVSVSDGSILLRHAASGRTHSIDDLDAELSARSLAGPWRLDGTARIDGLTTALSVSTGTADESGTMRLRVRAVPEGLGLALEADGAVRVEEGRPRYSGQFRLAAGQPPAAGQPAPYRAGGRFGLDHRLLSVDEFRLETGPAEAPYTADGSAEIDLGPEPRFLVRADGAQVRFEESAGEGEEFAGLDFAARLSAFSAFMADAPRPTIPGRVEVSLPAIVAGDTMVRDVHLSAEPSPAGWRIGSLGASLPGRTTLEASGELATGEELAFTGSLLLAIGQPSGFAAWLARDIDDAIRRLPAAGFSADVELSRDRQLFRDLELVLGGARFEGEIEHRQPPDARPEMALRLQGDSLDVEGMAAFASLFVSEAGVNRLAGHDLSFEIAAGPVSAAGLTAQRLDTAMRLRGGQLEIDRLAVSGLAGANVSATGTLRDFPARPTGSLDATVIAGDLAPLVATLAARHPDNALLVALAGRAARFPGLLADSRIDLMLSGAAEAHAQGAALSATGEAGGSAFTLTASTPALGPSLAETPGTLRFSASNEDAAVLYALYGLPALPFGFAGAAHTELSFEGTLAQGAQARFSVSGDELDAGFEGTAGWSGGQGFLRGTAHLASDDLEPWLMAAGQALPGGGYGLPVRLEAGIDYGEGLAVVSELSGQVAGSRVAGDLEASLRDGLPHLAGSLHLDAFDLALLVETVLGPEALAGDGRAWPSMPFRNSVATPFIGDAELNVRRLSVGNTAVLSDARFDLRLAQEGVSVTNFAANAFGGRLGGLFDLANDGGTALLSAQLRLEGGNLAALLPHGTLRGGAQLSAGVTANGMSVESLVQSLSGSGTARLGNLAIGGVAPGALPALLAGADRLGAQIEEAAVAAFAPAIVRAGSLRAQGLDLAFTIANGTARTPPFRIEVPGAVLAGELRMDLVAMHASADATLTFDAGDEALVGSEPAVRFAASGPLDGMSVETDTAPLAQFLSQRALELEQARVEAMQAQLLERQRLRREVRYYASLQQERARRLQEERDAEAARRAEEEARRRAVDEWIRQQESRTTEEDAPEEAVQQPANPFSPEQLSLDEFLRSFAR